MPPPATSLATVDAYLNALPEERKPVMERVRAALRRALPQAEESISYNIPALKIDGRAVLYFAAWKNHYSLYPVTDSLRGELGEALEGYTFAKGTIHVPWNNVPVRLLQRIARLRAQEAAAAQPPARRSPGAKPQKNARPKIGTR